MGGGLEGRPRQSRIFRIASGGWIALITLMRPPQRGHSRTSIENTRFRSSLRPAHVPCNRVHGRYRRHPLRVSLLPAAQARLKFVPARFGSLPGRLPQIRAAHHQTLAVDRDHQHRSHLLALTRPCQSPGLIKRIEVLSRIVRQRREGSSFARRRDVRPSSRLLCRRLGSATAPTRASSPRRTGRRFCRFPPMRKAPFSLPIPALRERRRKESTRIVPRGYVPRSTAPVCGPAITRGLNF